MNIERRLEIIATQLDQLYFWVKKNNELLEEFLKGGEKMDNQAVDPMPNTEPTPENIHLFRKEIDAVIQKAQRLQSSFGRNSGGREVSLVVTKLQEGKMWAGKILEAMGQPLPANLADKAE